MKCLYSKESSYRDLLGVRRFYSRPCGKCVACLHNRQDSIAIRALETSKRYPMFVYDTLTFRPEALPLVPVADLFKDRTWGFSDESKRMLSYYSEDCSVIPFVERDIVRNWLKRGREAFSRVNSGRRPDWKYLVFMEYGPKTSRPHFHVLFWNISKVDYKRFFGKPWYSLYGTTKPSYFNGNSTQKDRECITRYISKYCSKGVFESPWVKDGLLPKPMHFYSQGLGLSYLDDPKFDFFRSILAEVFKAMQSDLSEGAKGTLLEKSIISDLISRVDITEGFRVPSSALDAISVYYDSKGHPHPFPRYYKQKLLNLLKPNVFSYTIQNYLLVRAEHEANKRLQTFAFERGYFKACSQSPFLGLGRRLFDSLSRSFAVAERLQAYTSFERRKTRLINHYKRPLLGVGNSPWGVTNNFLCLVS